MHCDFASKDDFLLEAAESPVKPMGYYREFRSQP
jgi:hypothetical protein